MAILYNYTKAVRSVTAANIYNNVMTRIRTRPSGWAQIEEWKDKVISETREGDF